VEDLLQETFVRVHAGLDGLQDEARLSAWVHRIASNVLNDRFRRRSEEPSADPEAVPDRDEGEPNLNALVEGWLRRMIEQLPPDQRDALRMVELEGLAQDEVARRLGISLSGAKSRVQRGRQRLRAVLSACCKLDFDRYGNVVDYERNPQQPCDGC
jgi:RNA polymerase sigma-70 factor (ECF subfamily)